MPHPSHSLFILLACLAKDTKVSATKPHDYRAASFLRFILCTPLKEKLRGTLN